MKITPNKYFQNQSGLRAVGNRCFDGAVAVMNQNSSPKYEAREN